MAGSQPAIPLAGRQEERKALDGLLDSVRAGQKWLLCWPACLVSQQDRFCRLAWADGKRSRPSLHEPTSAAICTLSALW